MQRFNYQWAEHVRFSVDPQVVGEELDRIRERDGGVSVDAMLEEARPDDAPLHPLCTWDDAIAGEKWRKHELRKVCRSLRVIVQEQPQRALVHIKPEATSDSPGYYQPTSIVVKNIDEYELAFKAACQRIAYAEQALADLKRAASQSDGDEGRERRALIDQVTQALSIAATALAKAA